MNETKERYAADKLLQIFTQSRFGVFLIIAVALHVILTITTSVPYIHDFINPERVKQREAEAMAKQEKTTEGSNQKPVVQGTAPATPTPPSAQASATSASTSVVSKIAAGNQAAQLEQKKDTPIVKEIAEAAKPGEIPKKPDELGISIEDTNPR